MNIFKATTLIAATLIAGVGLSACAGAQPAHYKSLTYKPINTDIPKTKRVKLSNGMVVHLLPDHELPLVRVSAMIKVGSVWEEKNGVAALAGSVIRSGGTTTRSPDELDETLENIAASVEAGIGQDSGMASLSTLTKDFDMGLKILADVMRNPAFDKDRFELAKARMLDGIRRENDAPTSAAMRELELLLYEGSRYGTRTTLEDVQSITREDVVAFHRKFFVPQSIILGITGDFDESSIIAKLEDVFKGWKGATPAFGAAPNIDIKFEGGLFLAEKKLAQSVIRAGHLAVRRTHPDYHALRVVDKILGGGGFTSRITKKVRTDRGLAYSVWSYYFGGRWAPGKFLMGAETKTSSTGEVIKIFLEEVERIRTEPVTDEELELAKDSIINSFVFLFDKSTRIMDERLTLDYYDYPEDYLESYRNKVRAVTKEDVLRVAKKHLHAKGLKIVVVGDSEGFDKPLSEFGKVSPLSLRDYSKEH